MTFKEVIIQKISEIHIVGLSIMLYFIILLSGMSFMIMRQAHINTERFNVCIQSNPIENCRFIIEK